MKVPWRDVSVYENQTDINKISPSSLVHSMLPSNDTMWGTRKNVGASE